jgi:hypothetical protein
MGDRLRVDVYSSNLSRHMGEKLGAIAFATSDVENALPLSQPARDRISVEMLVDQRLVTAGDQPLSRPCEGFRSALFLHRRISESDWRGSLQQQFKSASGSQPGTDGPDFSSRFARPRLAFSYL